MKLFFLVLAFPILVHSQTIYELPFASENNEIELEIFNDSNVKLNSINVTLLEKPEWLEFESEHFVLSEFKPKDSRKFTFKFDVSPKADLLMESTIEFEIKSDQEKWGKEILVSVLPPEKFELSQNYPNPFNPSTKINYVIPMVEKLRVTSVHLIIYNILGQQVATLVNEEQLPGFYEVTWNPLVDGSNCSSGIYISQLSIEGANGKTQFLRKKMMFIK